jgi:hypothetical protein
MNKRFWAGTLSAVLLLTGMQLLPASASMFDTDLWTVRDYEDGTVSVSLNDKTLTEVEVPSEIEGKTITMLEVDGFKGCTALRKITVPDTVTVIDDYCFYECSALEEINFPEHLRNIGFQAFYGCSSLEGVQIPASVEEIEAFAFEGCSSLKGISVAGKNAAYKDEDGILFDKSGETLYLYPSALEQESYALPTACKTVYDYAFIGNPYLKSVDISGITSLGEDAFYYCTSLESLTIPEGIEELKGSVCGKCAALQTVTLPSTLRSIGESCFYGCMTLESAELPEGLETVSNYAFFNCPALTSVRLSANVTSIGDYAFGFYLDNSDKPKRLPDFEIDAEKNTAAFQYCAKNSIKCTGGVTQGSVFLYIVLGIVGVVILMTIVLLILQKRYQKSHELN